MSALTEDQMRILDDIAKERARQQALAFGGDTEAFDKTNTPNDWIAFITAYAGRASAKVARNEKEGQTFRANLVKVGALVLAALEAHDAGYFK